MKIARIILKWSLISVIFFIFYTLLMIILLSFFFSYYELVSAEKNQLDSSISSWIDPYGQGFDSYVKDGKNFKSVTRPDRSNEFLVIIELPKRNFIEIEQEFNRKKIDSSQISCKQSDYTGLCKIMDAHKEAQIKIYKIKRHGDDQVYWVLYKDREKLGVFSHIPLPYEFIYKKYIKAFNSELNLNVFDKFYKILSCFLSCFSI